MQEPVACINDRWLPISEASLSLFDAGFVFGATLVETQRTFQQQLRFLSYHLDRFYRNAKLTGIEPLPERKHLQSVLEELVEQNALQLKSGEELAVYLFITPGDTRERSAAPTWGVYSNRFRFERYRPYFQHGADLEIPEVSPVPAGVISPQIKHRSRFHWWLAEREVRKSAPVGESPLPLLTDENGHVYDTPIATFGYVRNLTIHFPKSEKILDSIGLKITKEMIVGQKIRFVEEDIHLSTLLEDVDEAFLTGSSIGVCAVRSISKTLIPKNPGPTTKQLQKDWTKLLGYDFSQDYFRGM
ncbi:aminotransferase class IV [Telmatocola sphagniphila]|uniref:Aminotransferase class IV n=1 Tax=Telmatocola sphagniphila TaxID=1123043 RepID=A0A8E6BAY9_9BACT|nr:aminotransferase class IV [Telmatocola sphagniphila]QVL33635.1 aminotransferase class IV [Telmatocola sphagniphila]